MDMLREVQQRIEASAVEWRRLFDAECSAYYALLDLAQAGTLEGPEWDAAASAHWRAVQALEQFNRRDQALSAALVEVVRCRK